jgi:hypothetical protein
MADTTQTHTAEDTMDIARLPRLGVVGLAIGVITWAIVQILARNVLDPLFCHSSDTESICGGIGWSAEAIGLGLASVGALFLLIRLRVFRPLLVVLFVAIATYGVWQLASSLVWYESALWLGLVYALAYMLFVWIASIDRFWLALVAGGIAAIALRIII